MSPTPVAQSPVFWLAVLAGVVLPQLSLGTVPRAITTVVLVALVVAGLVRERHQASAGGDSRTHP